MENRETFFLTLYQKVYPSVAAYISKMGGSQEEAKDVFQDALVMYYERTVNKMVPQHVNERAYLFGMARHLWLRRYKEGIRYSDLENSEDAMFDDDYAEPSSSRLLSLLETAGKKCIELLRAFYYDKQPLDKLASGLGYRSTHSVSVQKYKCLEQVRDHVKEKALTYEDFLD